ncbi:MAG TPA: hypothetical protein VNF91_07620 [Candidatus Acidoferrum sp.]|nr:hypothetical protein [Candidatus Acidoferrum sp.]
MADGAPISQEIKLPTDSAELGKAVLKLDELIGKLGKSGQAAKDHSAKHHDEAYKLRHEFGQMGHAAEYAHTEVKELLEFTGILEAIELTEKLVEKVIDIGKEAVKSAAEAERMNRVIDNASGGKVAGKENREWLEEFSKKTEFLEAQGEGAFVDLKKVGSSDQQAKLAIKAAADIAAVSKNKDEAFGATVEAFARLERTGKISNRTLAPLGLGEKDFASLPQFKGMNHKQLSAAIEKGSVSKNDLYALILARTGEKAIGEKASANADLLGTKLSKLSELPERFYKKLADTSALKSLTKGLDSILEKLDPESPKGKQISEFFEKALEEGAKLAGELGDAIDSIDFGAIGDSLHDDVIPAVEDLISLIKPAAEIIGTTVKGLAIAAHYISGNKTAQEQAAATSAYQGNKAAADSGSLWAKIKAPFLRHAAGADSEEAAVETSMGTMSRAKARQMGLLISQGVVEGIVSGKADVEKAAADLGDSSHEAFMSPAGIDAHSPSRKFHYGGQMAAEGVALGFESKANRIADAMTTTLGPRVTTGGGGRVATGGRAIHLTVAEGAVQMSVHGGAGGDIAGQVRDELRKNFVPILVDTLENYEDGA